MKPTITERDVALRAVLRAGDPAAEPVSFDAERMRRRVLAAPEPPPLRARPWLALAAAAAGMVALFAGYLRAPNLAPQGDIPAREVGGAVAANLAESGAVRQLQFETPGGTRIIWVVTDDRLP